MKKIISPDLHASGKRMALYARVSTQEQTKKDYPSCESQIEELEAFCHSRGWQVAKIIKDEGYSAGSLKRPGLTRVRFLVESGQIEGVLCTWYDRLTRSREFYVLDKEFRTHSVEFITLHDPADRNTASGRFMEMMLVGAKAYEREQTGEKVSIKMRMRAEKGMWNGGLVPFGFVPFGFVRGGDHVLSPDPDKSKLITQIFQAYVESTFDFVVRDWLKAHQIPAPGGAEVWSVGTIRDLLLNRRYIAEIEINKKNKGIEGLHEASAYRIVKAPHEPLIPLGLWEPPRLLATASFAIFHRPDARKSAPHPIRSSTGATRPRANCHATATVRCPDARARTRAKATARSRSQWCYWPRFEGASRSGRGAL